MTTLADDRRRGHPMAAGAAPFLTGPAWPRSCVWPGPRPVAAAARPGAGLRLAVDLLAAPHPPSGPPPTSSTSCTTTTTTTITMFQAVVEDIPPIRTPSGRRRRRPGKLHADRGYDSRANRAWLRSRGIRPRIARLGVDSSARLGRHRWKVERSLSWLSCWRRLQVRWDRDSGRWFAFVLVACAVMCCNRLTS